MERDSYELRTGLTHPNFDGPIKISILVPNRPVFIHHLYGAGSPLKDSDLVDDSPESQTLSAVVRLCEQI